MSGLNFDVKLSTYSLKSHTFNLFVSTDHVKFIDEINSVGLHYLEDNQIFCLLLVTGDVEEVIDYKEVLSKVDPTRSSYRIFENALYINDFEVSTINAYVDHIYRNVVGDKYEDELNVMWSLGEQL